MQHSKQEQHTLSHTSFWSGLWQTLIRQRWQLLILFAAILLPLFVFGELAEEVIEQEAFSFDDPILLYANSLATPSLDKFMLIISDLGYGWVVLPLAIISPFVLLVRKHRLDALFFGLSVAGAGLLNQLAKALFARERPKLWPSIAPEATFSFPSGHAMGSMALVAAMVVVLWPTRWRYPALVLGGLFVLLVGLSRIYLGVHYPSDVLAGWGAALAWVMGVSALIYRRIGKPPVTQG